MFSANSSQVSEDRLYVEDVFSTYLYTGNVSTRTITNDIDLAGKGGLVWIKARSAAGSDHNLFDTNRGATKRLFTNSATTETTTAGTLTSFQPTGFTLGSSSSTNASSTTYASWTFRKAPKFFDVVTYTGTGTSTRISHNLGVAPGCILVKVLSTADNWMVYHRSTGIDNATFLNRTDASGSTPGAWGTSAPTATDFGLGASYINNTSGQTYVAYLFAHDTTSDGIIQCGSTDGVSTVNLGWEPQWVMIKKTNSTSNWTIIDTMRGWTAAPGDQQWIYPNLSNAEAGPVSNYGGLNSTGFSLNFTSGDTYIYIAIRRGPMRTPTSGTSVFAPTLTSSYGANNLITTGFPVDLCLGRVRANGYSTDAFDRLRGTAATSGRWLSTNTTDAEQTNGFYGVGLTSNTGFFSNWWTQDVGVQWNFRRAPSFFDVVCWTNSSSTSLTTNHSLGIVPEMVIVKRRGPGADGWMVRHKNLPSSDSMLFLNSAGANSTGWTGYSSTATTLTYDTYGNIGDTYVAYLFGTASGVSKVGSYTGNGSSQTINCGFAAGARFVMIKRTDSTGDWYVWDTARGIVNDGLIGSYYANNTTANYGLGVGEYRIYYNSDLGVWRWDAGTFSASSGFGSSTDAVNNLNSVTGWFTQLGSFQSSTGIVDFYAIDRYTSSSYASGEDPRLSLNTTAAEVTSDDAIDPNATGFVVNQTAASNINVSSATYIYLAVA